MVKNIQVIDNISRSVGILKTAKVLNNDEFMELISKVRLGFSIGLIKGISYDIINEITVKSQPFMLMQAAKEELTPLKIDQKRAELINEEFNKVEVL